jgi:hypothetical protein
MRKLPPGIVTMPEAGVDGNEALCKQMQKDL